MFLSDINILISKLTSKLIIVILFIIIFSLIISYFFSKHLSNPIKKLVLATNKISKGDFDIKLNITNNDETKILSNSFLNMNLQIKELFNKIKYQKDLLNNIISTMREGVIVINNNEIIKLSNPSCLKILNIENIENKNYWKSLILCSLELNTFIKEGLDTKKNASKEIEINNKKYLCYLSNLNSYNGIIIILYDISIFEEVNKIKKEFISNVSHELRTPLTAIKGYLETALTEINPNNNIKNYLKIVYKHTERLVNIVKDLLTLSNLESSKVSLEYSKINLKDIINNSLELFNNKISNKKIEILFKPKDIIIFADSFKLQYVLINLIDNAIKYTDKGYVNIEIDYTKNNQYVTIKIKDTGIGIPKENIPRLFERFYVVNKSRSRESGGTGLGLSIVKHIILLHKGNIIVNSEVEKGSEFILTLPV